MQLPLFVTSQSEWRPPALADLPDWGNATRVGLDTETRDPRLKTLGPRPFDPDAYVVGVSFCIEGDRPYYLPLRHENGDNCEGNVLGYLREQAGRFTGTLVGANLPYDLEHLAEEGVLFPKVAGFRDVQIADPLVYEMHQNYSLAAIAERWGMPGKDERLLACAARDYDVDPKGGLWQLPARFVGPYAEQDAALPLTLLREQEKVIEAQGLWEVFDLESRLQPVLLKMRRRGVRVDLDHLERVEKWARGVQSEALQGVKVKTGITLQPRDIWKGEALEPVLNYLGVEVPRTPKAKKAKVDKEILAAVDHEAIRALEQARGASKRLQFADSIRDHLAPDGRIHCSYSQLRRQRDDGNGTAGAAYGRLACSHPNLQQQESDPFWRKIYLPEEGQLWGANDYSGQEVRMLVEYAGKAVGARQAVQRYIDDPDTDQHQETANMVGISRKQAKTIQLGIAYGMGQNKLAAQLGLSEQEGRELLRRFNQRVPYIKQLAKSAERVASRRGFVKTLLGRRCRFPKEEDGTYGFTHKAVNRIIQGASADQTKQALIQVDEAGFDLLVQVHDEIALSVNSREEAREAARIMETTIQTEVPFKVDTETGASWGASMEDTNGP